MVTIEKQDRKFALLLIICIAALLRIPLALQPGLWADEIFSLAMATGHSLEHPTSVADPALGDYLEPHDGVPSSFLRSYLKHEVPPAGAGRVIRAVFLSDTSPPLYYLLLNAWTRIAGTQDAALRLFSTVFALACFPLLWSLGLKIGGRKTALTSCILFTFSPPALHYSAEGRMYSLLWFIALCLVWLTLEVPQRGARPHLLFLWILMATAGLLTHYFFAFVLATCFFWLWLQSDKLSRTHTVVAALLVGAFVLPWYYQIPESLSHWRVTAGWLEQPLTWMQVLTGPFLLAWSLLSGFGPWGGVKEAELVAAGLWAILIIVTLRGGVWHLLSGSRTLIWFWVLAAALGPVMFDLLMHTMASTMWRYALAGLPAAMLLAGLAISQLHRKTHAMFLLSIILAWLPGITDVYSRPSRPWEPFREVSKHLAERTDPSTLIIVHSIPGGVLGIARYLDINTPIASWVVQLGRRHMPEDMISLVKGRCRIALVKIHDLGESSPAEVWLRDNGSLEHLEKFSQGTEILYFHPGSSIDDTDTSCNRAAQITPKRLAPSRHPRSS